LPHFIGYELVLQMETLNEKLILRNKDLIQILNFQGIEEAQIKVNSHQMMLHKNKIHLIVSKEKEQSSFQFQIYNLQGILQFEYSLIVYKTNYFLSYNNGKIDYCMDKDTRIVRKYQY
jgi:hypothetical protein